MELFGLFVISFVAASLYPLGSEAFVVGLIALGYDWRAVLFAASSGNALGALTTYAFGRFFSHWPRFKRLLARAEQLRPRVAKYAEICAFFSFLPIVGDVFVFALGAMRFSLPVVALFVTLGKVFRYLLLIYLTRLAAG